LGLRVQHGALVIRVWKGSPAVKAGLLSGTQQVIIGNTIVIVGGDLITAANGLAVNSAEELRRLLRKHLPGDIIKLDVIRQGKRAAVEVTLGERPRNRTLLKE
jgi:S1-C subfamily serine protease